MLQDALTDIGVEFDTHVNLGSYNFDIVLANGTLVEVDGDYWHSLPAMKERDRHKDSWAKDSGLTLHRFRESDVYDAPHECAYLALVEA